MAQVRKIILEDVDKNVIVSDFDTRPWSSGTIGMPSPFTGLTGEMKPSSELTNRNKIWFYSEKFSYNIVGGIVSNQEKTYMGPALPWPITGPPSLATPMGVLPSGCTLDLYGFLLTPWVPDPFPSAASKAVEREARAMLVAAPDSPNPRIILETVSPTNRPEQVLWSLTLEGNEVVITSLLGNNAIIATQSVPLKEACGH